MGRMVCIDERKHRMDKTSVTNAQAKWAVVTGGSVRGGLAITQALHQRGLSVVVHHGSAVSAERAQSVVDALNAERPQSALRWQAALDEAAALPYADLPIQTVICNASQLSESQLDDLSRGLDDFRAHVLGHAALLASVQDSLKREQGSVVAVTDIQTVQPNADFIWYHVAKGGLETLVRTLAVQWAPYVRCNAIAPGPLNWHDNWTDDARRVDILKSTPLGRAGSFEELAQAVAWLALDASYVNGQIVKMDGGRSAWLR